VIRATCADYCVLTQRQGIWAAGNQAFVNTTYYERLQRKKTGNWKWCSRSAEYRKLETLHLCQVCRPVWGGILFGSLDHRPVRGNERAESTDHSREAEAKIVSLTSPSFPIFHCHSLAFPPSLLSRSPLRKSIPLMLNSSRPRFLLPTHAAAADSQSPEDPPRSMDQPPPSSSGRGGGPTTPRRQLQGPRPPRLNVRMESHAIKKPAPTGPPPPAQTGPQGSRRDQQHPARAPVIIYDASPKVIHAAPSEFMALVQRLTGAQPRPPSEAHLLQADHDGMPFLPPELPLSPSAAMSPAARLATIERSVRPMPEPAPLDFAATDAYDGTLAAVLGPARPGILSPLPSSLPPTAASGSFSPLPFDPNSLSWINELSPILRAASTAGAGTSSAPGAGGPSNGASGRPPPPAYYSDPFVPSPRNLLLATPTIPSPTTCAEFFGSLPDF
jgi:MAP kinase substrate 1